MGQIKNIKLHIVTDIKRQTTQHLHAYQKLQLEVARYQYLIMDRGSFGFVNNYRGNNFNPNFRDRADRSDRRYDDFYADRNRGPPGGQNRTGGRYNSNKPWNNRRGGGPPRVGDKRRNDMGHNKYTPSKKKGRDSPSKDKEDKDETKVIEEIPDIPDEEVVVPDSLMDSVETLRMRSEIERNAADEDVQKLVVFCFTGKGYQCRSCGLLLTKESSFVSHLTGKSHVMNVIDARTAKKYQEVRDILDIDLTPDDWFEKNDAARAIIMKQSKMHMKAEREQKAKAEANFNKTPSNFFDFNMELRKSVIKKEEKVVITSLVESTVEVSDFTGERFFGCEFVRAVTGFHCRLCSINIREAKGVLPHIDSRQHKNNYSAYIKRNPEYEKSQKEQSQELFDVMSQHDAASIVLAESTNVEKSHFLKELDHELVRIPTIMNPELKKKEKEEKEKKEKEEKEKAEKEAKEKEEAEAAAKAEEEKEGEDEESEEKEAEGEEEEEESEEKPEEEEAEDEEATEEAEEEATEEAEEEATEEAEEEANEENSDDEEEKESEETAEVADEEAEAEEADEEEAMEAEAEE